MDVERDDATVACQPSSRQGEDPAPSLSPADDAVRRWLDRSIHLLMPIATSVTFGVSYLSSFFLRFEFAIPSWYFPNIVLYTLPVVIVTKLAAFHAAGVYRILWGYVGFRDILRILSASILASGIIALGSYLFLRNPMIPRTVLIMDWILTFLAVAGLFALVRMVRESRVRGNMPAPPNEPVFIAGAGDAGEMLLREFQLNTGGGVRVAGFLDDDPRKKGRMIRGVTILGRIDQAKELARERAVRKAFIAIPSANGSTVRGIAATLLKAGLALKILPPHRILALGSGFVPQLKPVFVEDLLRRETVELDVRSIASSIQDRVVLVTGAAGSIGSEISRQLLDFHPSKLVLLDCAETPLHHLMLNLRAHAASRQLAPELADITDASRIDEVFSHHRPKVVFHAAALKHVPLLESYPREALRVNVGGTKILADAARKFEVEKFVFISTDKAVNPASIMGASKRLAEMVLVEANGNSASTRYVSVRFGNVLGSNGSVVPIFREQLARGGPLTVTHPEMRRYFMTISEAVQLVLQASVLGQTGGVYILDMGQPVKIVDLAEDLIRLSGLIPGVDVKIEFTGIRKGEKLFEELRLDSETVTPTSHPQVFLLRSPVAARSDDVVSFALGKLWLEGASHSRIVSEIRRLLPSFISSSEQKIDEAS